MININESEILRVKQRFGIIGNSPLLNHAIKVAIQASPTEMTVLITGESGSGKESFSKIIHALSRRRHSKFIAINCGAIPEGTIDSELFGHEKGSFTGAHEARKGYFEVTDGGSIFLDEIAEMPLGTQARLLRVLENGECIKVGSSKVLKTDVRVIAATNVNLIKAVDKGKFREDLYYRMNTVPIYVPPLRQRGDDITLLFRKFSVDFSETYKVKPVTLSEDARELLTKFPFPGNIRQLKNLAEQISLLEYEREINAETLVKYLPKTQSTLPVSYSNLNSNKENSSDFTEREILYKVLFDMKNDLNDLKKLTMELMESGNHKKVQEEHEGLIQKIYGDEEDIESEEMEDEEMKVLQIPQNQQENKKDKYYFAEEIEEEETLSLQDKELELIKKSLERHSGKRKTAAEELGISERTLYRKIKQYNL